MNRNWNRRNGLAGIIAAAGLCSTLWICDASALARSNDLDGGRTIPGATVKPLFVKGGQTVMPLRDYDGALRVSPRYVKGMVTVRPMRDYDGALRVSPRYVKGMVTLKPMRDYDGALTVRPLDALKNLPWIRTLIGCYQALSTQ